MTKPAVFLYRMSDRYTTVRRAAESIATRVDWAQHHQVFIKPNLVSTTHPLADTHPDALRAVLDVVRSYTRAPIVIGEGTATQNTWLAYHRMGYVDLVAHYKNVSLLDLNRAEPVSMRAYRHDLRPMTLQVARPVLDASLVISVGPPKTHDFVIVTLSLKNVIMGTLISRFALTPPPLHALRNGRPLRSPFVRALKWARQSYDRLPARLQALPLFEWPRFAFMAREPRSDKFRMHQSYPVLHLNLFIMAYQGLRPHISIIDGWEGMEGDGPTSGSPVPWHIAVASRDALAADAFTADAMGYPLEKVGYLYYAHMAGLGQGDIQRMHIQGNVDPDEIRRTFRPHRLIANQLRWQDARVTARIREILTASEVDTPKRIKGLLHRHEGRE